jgi:hypothetical protein
MGLFEYQKRITALEGRFDEAERHTRRLLRFVRYCPDKIRPEALRAQLDLVKALISLTKEESAFYAKLGRLYDFAKFCDDFMDILKRVDPDLTLDIIREIGERWTERMANQPDGLKK